MSAHQLETPVAFVRKTPPTWLVVAAYAAVYLLWGSTYLGIRVAIESIPPMLMAGTRFFTAGIVLYTFMRMKGATRPRPIHWRNAGVVGRFW